MESICEAFMVKWGRSHCWTHTGRWLSVSRKKKDCEACKMVGRTRSGPLRTRAAREEAVEISLSIVIGL